MPKYLCLQRSLPGGAHEGEKPSPAQMQAMYAKFNRYARSSATRDYTSEVMVIPPTTW